LNTAGNDLKMCEKIGARCDVFKPANTEKFVMRNKLAAYLTLGLFLCSSNLKAYADPPVNEGKVIFNSRCASCHNVNKILTGPALAGVDQRYSIDWIVNFVHSSQAGN